MCGVDLRGRVCCFGICLITRDTAFCMEVPSGHMRWLNCNNTCLTTQSTLLTALKFRFCEQTVSQEAPDVASGRRLSSSLSRSRMWLLCWQLLVPLYHASQTCSSKGPAFGLHSADKRDRKGAPCRAARGSPGVSAPMYVGLDRCSNQYAAARTCSSTACELEAIPSLTSSLVPELRSYSFRALRLWSG
jgi:hypothetical protein